MNSRGVLPQELSFTDYEVAVDACKWIAATSADPLERVLAFKKVFELRNQQLEQGRTA